MRAALRVVVVVSLLAASACGVESEPTPPASGDGPPGQLIDAPVPFASYPILEALVQKSVRVRYRSTSGVDGSRTVVSGVVLVPNGSPPVGGWPIASIGHPTAGIDTSCAPSAYPGLMGNLTTVIPFLINRFAVVMSDYQGLGTPGPHPYLDPTTAGYNVIDAVRAVRKVVPQTSDAWVSYGVSQGGQAVWAANELSSDYGAGLRLLGSISVSTPTDLRPLVDAMVAGTLTTSQKVLIPLVLKGIHAVHPELVISDYLRGVMLKRLDVFLTCAGDEDGLKAIVAESAKPVDTMPIDEFAANRLREWLGEFSVPRQRAAAPMLVAQGDADQIILPAWTSDGVRQACELGDVVDLMEVPGQGHGVLDLGNLPATWLQDRLAGLPAPSTCASR